MRAKLLANQPFTTGMAAIFKDCATLETMADSLMDSSCVSIPQLEAVKSELLASYLEFSERGLLQSAEWSAVHILSLYEEP